MSALVSGVDRSEGLWPLVWRALSCHAGGHAVKDGCQPYEREMGYLCCQEGKAGGMEAERGRKQAGRGKKKQKT